MGHEGRRQPVILVVDDNLDAREMYCMYLRHEGFDCIEAATGQAALHLARECRPALVLMDATMPGLDGWAATSKFRADPELEGIPIVMLTAHAFEEHRRRAHEVGADGFLAKPVLPDVLAAEVRDFLQRTSDKGR